MDTEVIIVGGGPVGAAQACALAVAGIPSVVVERGDPAVQLDAEFDGRAFAIAYATRHMLEATGIWAHVVDPSPIHDIRVSEGNAPLFLHFNRGEGGEGPFGHMVEARHLRRALHARLAELPQVTFLARTELTSLERDEAGVIAHLSGGRTVSARLAVAAEGRLSRLRDEAGIRTTGWRYGQKGIVCTVEHARPHGNVAHEHFMPSGPFAILPLTGRRCSLVWVEPERLADRIMALDDREFLAELSRRFGDFLGELTLTGPRWCYPLALQFAHRAHARRLVLIGDSLHAMHPIAGQGLNMGLRDVATLAEVLADSRRLGLDLGDAAALARYERWRRFDNFMMMVATDGLTRIFSNDFRPLKRLRNVGMAAIGLLPPLKRLAMRHHMGTLGELPKLLRGEAL